MNTVLLHISTAQGPAECQIFARFVVQRLIREAKSQGIAAAVQTASESKYGMISATVKLNGAAAETWSQRWLGTLQWICSSPVRKQHLRKNWYIGIFRLPDEDLPEYGDGEIVFQTCRAGGKGGQHVNKTESAVRATHTPSGISVRVESERSQHANKKRALALLSEKLAEAHSTRAEAYARQKHVQLYQVERGNPVKVFEGLSFRERKMP